MTVNRPYAEVMARRFDLPLPVIVMNCSYRREPPAERPRRFHDALALVAERPGRALPGRSRPGSRHRAADRGPPAARGQRPPVPARLRAAGVDAMPPPRGRTRTAGRLHVLPAVPPTELLDWVASADIVAMPIQPSTLNHRLTTPNKLFEAMAAGVPVVASDLPGMAPIVAETGCGVVCDPTDPAAIADAIRSIFALSADEREAMSRARPRGSRGAVFSGRPRWRCCSPSTAGLPASRGDCGARSCSSAVRPRRTRGPSGSHGHWRPRASPSRSPRSPRRACRSAKSSRWAEPARRGSRRRPSRAGRRSSLRRYAPSGPWKVLGASEAATSARADVDGDLPPTPGRRVPLARRLASPFLSLRRWLFWPHAVRGWWATLARDLAPADLYHACGSLTIAAGAGRA